MMQLLTIPTTTPATATDDVCVSPGGLVDRQTAAADCVVLWTDWSDQARAAPPELALRRDSESMATATMSTSPVTMNSHCTARPRRNIPL